MQSTQARVNTRLTRANHASNNAQTISPRPNPIDESTYFSNADGTTTHNYTSAQYTTIEPNKNSISYAKDSLDQSAAKAYGHSNPQAKTSITNKTVVSAGSTNAHTNFK